MVAHCLLVETGSGLVLVDTGFGLDDVRDPPGRMGYAMMVGCAPRCDASECAVRQVEALGFSADDVTDIVVTHLDLDHAGGLPDFPRAKVHVFGAELDAAMARASVIERERYKPAHWAHGPDWVRHGVGGDRWMGFASVRAITDRAPEVAMVPLHGHTRGHVAVAVQDGDGWLLHAGDAYFSAGEMRDPPYCPPAFRVFQRAVAIDDRERRANQERLRVLAAGHPEVRVFCAHDAEEFDRMATGA